MALAMPACPPASDKRFGPRVDVSCRSFDFTLLFEDAIFEVLPAAVFLLLIPARLQALRGASVKLESYQLAIWKLSLLGILFLLHILFMAFHTTTASLVTKASLTSDILNIIALFAAGVQSFIEDQRSVSPSDLLVTYFSASTLLALPRLRSLWLIPSTTACRVLWTMIFIGTVAVLLAESARKLRLLRPLYRTVTAEQLSSFWGRSFFIWVLPIFRAGYSHILEIGDIPEVDEDLQSGKAGALLQHEWFRSNGSSHELLKATFHAYRWTFFSGAAPRLLYSAFTFCQPFLISATLNYMNAPRSAESKKYGQALIGAFALVYLGLAISRAVCWRQTYRLNTMIRSGLISVIYKHTTSLREQDARDKTAVTLMGTDVERIAASLKYIHDAWASFVEVAIAVILLERQISYVCVVPVIFCIVSVAATGPLSTNFRKAQKLWVSRVEKRVAVTSNMLGDMKAVKMLDLTDVLSVLIINLRKFEMKASESFRKLLVWRIVISNTPVQLAPFATFALYAIIASVKDDRTLLSTQAFTSLSLISLLTEPLLSFCQAAPTILQAVGSFDRIEEYLKKTTPLNKPVTSGLHSLNTSRDELELLPRRPGNSQNSSLAIFEDASISWSHESENVFNSLTLNIQRGITMIIGQVGSGKSTLIQTLLGETVLKSGVMKFHHSRIAYCTQSPWLMNETIRHNITGGFAFDQKWYDSVIWACALENDLQFIPGGDMFKVGSNGVALSGGQKQRVTLARAVYSRLPLAILDDSFSGLDSNSIKVISTRLFDKDGLFRQAGQSVILATHTQRLLPYADDIIVFDNGAVVDQGPYGDVLQRSPDMIAKYALSLASNVTSNIDDHELSEGDGKSSAEPSIRAKEAAVQAKDPRRRDGTWSVYKYYAKSAGYSVLITFLVINCVEPGINSGSTLWFARWVDSNEKHPNGQLGMYLGVYGLFFVLSLAGMVISCWIFFVKIINNTAMNLHFELLKAALRASFSFFQVVDSGSIINRFSQDLDLIDMNLPNVAVVLAARLAVLLFTLIILCVVGKYLAASLPVFAIVLFFVQRYYLRTSRQVRLLDIEAKAPLYSHFLETVQGLSTVRAYDWGSEFHNRADVMLNTSQKPFYMLFCIQLWLELVLNLVTGALAVIIAAMATSLSDKLSPGSIGVALNLILGFTFNLTQTIKAWTLLETSIGAVARIQNFVRDTPSEERHTSSQPPSLNEWPSRGSIEFKNVVASYNPGTPPVLKNLSLSIAAGEKIAVCGPSGSGKTSLILAILQMIDVVDGSVVVDGWDLSSLEGRDVRSHMNVVPQDPFFMPGTVRFNLDPHQRAPDESIESALHKVGLHSQIVAKGGLDAELAASEWSAGERQLLALARALVVQSRILILDEAASSVDHKTESIMQDIIEKEFSHQTVISVVHRLRYIDRFDKVAVLKQGSLLEFDDPKFLLNRDSELRKLYLAMQRDD